MRGVYTVPQTIVKIARSICAMHPQSFTYPLKKTWEYKLNRDRTLEHRFYQRKLVPNKHKDGFCCVPLYVRTPFDGQL
jgi:hypothetical protein